MRGSLIGAGCGVAIVGGVIALARYGRARFAKECQTAWSGVLDVAPNACVLDAGNYNWFTALQMGVRALTGGNVYAHYVPANTPPSSLFVAPPGQVMPPGQIQIQQGQQSVS